MALTQFMIFREKLRGENQNTKFKIPFCIYSGVLCVCMCVGYRKSIRWVFKNQFESITDYHKL